MSKRLPPNLHEYANQAPQPRLVEWATAYPLIDPNRLPELEALLERVSDPGVMEMTNQAYLEGATGWAPEIALRDSLPDGTIVTIRLNLPTMASLSHEPQNTLKVPWEIRGSWRVEDGLLRASELPLMLQIGWRNDNHASAFAVAVAAHDGIVSGMAMPGAAPHETNRDGAEGYYIGPVLRMDNSEGAFPVPGSVAFLSGMTIAYGPILEATPPVPGALTPIAG